MDLSLHEHRSAGVRKVGEQWWILIYQLNPDQPGYEKWLGNGGDLPAHELRSFWKSVSMMWICQPMKPVSQEELGAQRGMMRKEWWENHETS